MVSGKVVKSPGNALVVTGVSKSQLSNFCEIIKYILSNNSMNINSTNQEKIKYAEYGTPHTIRA
jgi:hypothetical protein